MMNELNMDPVFFLSLLAVTGTAISFIVFAMAKRKIKS
ncbi:hypothetical protein MNB_SUP05-4-236 [hydrothermal vent metagenome]|jgi:hypothetical protein|uniref:Uncharacterized protein n=1 Tax=hydrothermal vent metagenome TaxID=652676 RepID=A0A1W1D7U6_9ZZZZ